MRRTARRAGLGVIAVCLAGAAAGCGGSQGQQRLGTSASTGTAAIAALPEPVTLAGYYAQKLRWRSCDNGFQCARLLVPFDYSRPAWRRFSLPVIRLRATGAAGQRIGPLVVNPGGPGGSGVQYALAARSEFSATLRARFDIVGFDPRGVGGSEPALHCLTGPRLDQFLETSDAPSDTAQLNTVIAQSKLFASGCEQNSGALLPYVGTRDAARDLDVLRAALGEPKLSYLGKSYGTYLGAWYAQLFPGHVRALVLDGAVDPDASSIAIDLTQAQGFQVALRSFAASCMAKSACPLGHGTDVSAGIARLQALLTRANATPLANDLGDGRPADGAMLLNGVVSALYSTSYWPVLRTALRDAFGGDGTVLIELADALTERNRDGTYSNLVDSNTVINCLDRPWPHALTDWRAAAAAAAKAAPQFGASIVWGSLACAYWPVASYPLPAIRAAGAPPILVVGTTRDPATPYRWAQALARDLASGVLLGWNGDGHTAYMSGSSCVDNAVDSYLTGLAVPRSGTVCG